jgi:hypothetical protein
MRVHVAVEIELALLEDRLYGVAKGGLHDLVKAVLAVDPPADQPLADIALDLLDDREGDIGFQKAQLQLPQEFVDLLLVDLAATVAYGGLRVDLFGTGR